MDLTPVGWAVPSKESTDLNGSPNNDGRLSFALSAACVPGRLTCGVSLGLRRGDRQHDPDTIAQVGVDT